MSLMLSTSLILPGEPLPETDPEQIQARLGHLVELIIDGGAGGLDATTVLDLTGPGPQIIRLGKGELGSLPAASPHIA